MIDFESVQRFDPSEVLTDRWEMGSMDKVDEGDYVYYDVYKDLLDAYKELLWMREELEK